MSEIPQGDFPAYHKMFQRLSQNAIMAVRETAGQGLWQLPDFEGFILLNRLAEKLNEIYGLPPVRVELHAIEAYNPRTSTIGLPKISMVSFLHEYRHHMQANGKQHYSDIVKDARGWSISMFRRACPGSFRRARAANLIWFCPPEVEQIEDFVVPEDAEDYNFPEPMDASDDGEEEEA